MSSWDSSSSSESETTSSAATQSNDEQKESNPAPANVDKDNKTNTTNDSDKDNNNDNDKNSAPASADKDNDTNTTNNIDKDDNNDNDNNSTSTKSDYESYSSQSSDNDSNSNSTKSDSGSNSNSSNSGQESNSNESSDKEADSNQKQKELAQSQTKIENVPSFSSFDQNEIKMVKTLPNRTGRRNTTSAFSKSLTPGSTFLESQRRKSKISFLQDKLRKSDEENDGPISKTLRRNRALTMSSASIPNLTHDEPENKDGPPPFTYDPVTEYEPLPQEKYLPNDNQVSEFIQNHQNLQNYSWNEQMVEDVNEQDNPFYSPYADYLKEKDTQSSNNKFQTAIPVRIFSEKIKQIEMKDVAYPDREDYPLSASITFIADTNKPESDDRQPPSIFGSYYNSQPPLPKHFGLNPIQKEILTQDKLPYLGLTLKEFTMDPAQLEPFFFTGYLYQNKKFISEEWHFASDSTAQINQDSNSPLEINLNKQGVFELPLDYEDANKLKTTFIVVAVSHPITIDGNAPVNKYYLKGSSFESNAKSNIAKTFPNKNADVLTPFAYSFVNLADFLKEAGTSENGDANVSSYTFTRFYAIDSQFSASKIKDNIQDSLKKKVKEGDFKMKLRFDLKLMKALHPSIDFEGFELVNLTEIPPPATRPTSKLCHKIAIHIDQVNFKLPKGVKGRNVYGEISLKTDEDAEGLKCLHSQLNAPNLTTIGKTRCFYHQPKGVFDEVFVFDLPYPIPPKLFIHCNFYHLVLKKSKESKTWIGHVCVPIFESSNGFIKDGPHSYTVHYKHGESGNGSKVEPNNSLSFSTLISSTLVPSDPKLCNFFNNVSNVDLKDANKVDMIYNLYAILENLVEYAKTSPICACKEVGTVYNALHDQFKEKLDEHFQVYAQVLSLRNPSPEYHQKILEGLGGCPILPAGVYQFFFILIIKSIYLTKDKSFVESYAKFLDGVPTTIAQNATKESVIEYAKFINLLMDIGCYCASIEGAVAMLYRIMKKPEASLFVYEVFRPKFLYLSIMNSDRMVEAILEMLRYARVGNENIFLNMNNAMVVLPEDIKKEVSCRLLDTLLVISPLDKMPFARSYPNGRVHPVIAYFGFILECMTESEPIYEWFSGIENPHEFFDSLHFLLDITAVNDSTTKLCREIAYSIQAAILNAMTIMINVNEQMRELGFLTYHVLCSNIVADFLPILISIPTVIAEKDISFLFKYYCPPLPKILVNLFKISNNEGNSLQNFITTLFNKDRERYGDTRRSLALITRSLYHLNLEELQKTLDNLKQGREIEDDQNHEYNPNNYSNDTEDSHEFFNRGSLEFLTTFVTDCVDINKKLNDPSLDFETKGQLYYRLIEMFQYSPDVTIEFLNRLSQMNIEADYIDEAAQAKLLIAAIILEYLTLQNRIKPLFNEFHAAKAFESICSLTSFATYKDDDCPHIIGFCDSPKFNLKSLISLLLNLTKMSFNNNSQMLTYEQSLGYIGIIWPILENQKSFYYAQRFFKIEYSIQKTITKIPPGTDPLYGHYFRIAYFGDVFGKDDGKTYIYHEKMLTHLFELSNALVEKYKSKFPGTPIELIKESGEVDRDKLDTKGKGYIQVTFVEPFFPKSEQLLRTSQYDQSHMIKTFKFDTPFTQNKKAAQSSIEHQWLRRTLLTVKNRMPSIFKVEEVIEIVNKDFEPIKVSYRQLHDRCAQIQAAISQNDFTGIQRLLHGSLLVMVNEGPSRMAEVFLSDDSKGNLEGDPSEMDKYQQKLRSTFKLFLKVNEEALKLHADYVTTNPIYIPLQNELEAGFASLKDKMSKYIDVDDDNDELN